jgi:hypothetical protein
MNVKKNEKRPAAALMLEATKKASDPAPLISKSPPADPAAALMLEAKKVYKRKPKTRREYKRRNTF